MFTFITNILKQTRLQAPKVNIQSLISLDYRCSFQFGIVSQKPAAI